MLKFVVLKIGAFFRAVCHSVLTRYGSARMRCKSDHNTLIGPLRSYYWKLALRIRLCLLMEMYGSDSVMCLLSLARANEIDFDVAEELSWFAFNFKDSIAYGLRAFEDLGRSAFMYSEVSVLYIEEWRENGMDFALAQWSSVQYRRDRTDLF